jgi:hypothetical protein
VVIKALKRTAGSCGIYVESGVHGSTRCQRYVASRLKNPKGLSKSRLNSMDTVHE